MFNRFVGELCQRCGVSSHSPISGFIPIGVFGDPAVDPGFCLFLPKWFPKRIFCASARVKIIGDIHTLELWRAPLGHVAGHIRFL